MKRAIHRAVLRMDLVNSLDSFADIAWHDKMIDDVNAFYHKYVVFRLDLASDIGSQPARVNLARFQRAAECAGQSAACSGDNIVGRCCVRRKCFRANTVMCSNGAVNAENNRLGFRGKVGTANGPCFTLNSNVRDVHWV